MFSDSSFRSEIKSHLARNACEMSAYEEREQDVPDDTQRAASPGFSCVSMKSHNSMIQPPYLSDVDAQRATSPGFSCVSMKSNNSMILPPKLSDSPAVSSDPA